MFIGGLPPALELGLTPELLDGALTVPVTVAPVTVLPAFKAGALLALIVGEGVRELDEFSPGVVVGSGKKPEEFIVELERPVKFSEGLPPFCAEST
jgi:hypothetical protein